MASSIVNCKNGNAFFTLKIESKRERERLPFADERVQPYFWFLQQIPTKNVYILYLIYQNIPITCMLYAVQRILVNKIRTKKNKIYKPFIETTTIFYTSR